MDNSIKNSRSLNCSDPEDEHEVLDKSVETDQLKECEKQKKLVNLRGKKRGLAFLKRKWTIPEILTTCALFFEVFGWVRIVIGEIS